MKIEFVSDDAVFDDIHGRIVKGQVIDFPNHKAMFYLEEGVAVCYQTKVLQDRPLVVAGKVEPSSAAPADQAYATKTLNESNDGAKKRGRKKKEA